MISIAFYDSMPERVVCGVNVGRSADDGDDRHHHAETAVGRWCVRVCNFCNGRIAGAVAADDKRLT